jgi:hypothetical protein
VYAPTGFVNQTHLADAIAHAAQKLGPEAVHVAYSVRADSTGVPSIFFRITLTDAAIREDTLAEVTDRIATVMIEDLRPIENWGLHPYFNFRSQSDQRRRPDPEWD